MSDEALEDVECFLGKDFHVTVIVGSGPLPKGQYPSVQWFGPLNCAEEYKMPIRNRTHEWLGEGRYELIGEPVVIYGGIYQPIVQEILQNERRVRTFVTRVPWLNVNAPPPPEESWEDL